MKSQISGLFRTSGKPDYLTNSFFTLLIYGNEIYVRHTYLLNVTWTCTWVVRVVVADGFLVPLRRSSMTCSHFNSLLDLPPLRAAERTICPAVSVSCRHRTHWSPNILNDHAFTGKQLQQTQEINRLAYNSTDVFNACKQSMCINHGGAAAWAGWAMALPKFWLGGPQCIWPHQ